MSLTHLEDQNKHSPKSLISEAPTASWQNLTSEWSDLRAWDLAALGLLVASVIAVFWKVLFTSAMFFYRDICNYTYPTTQLIRELCRQGILPYWNPYLNYGQSVLGNPNLLFFYPSTPFIILLPFDLAYKLHFVLHFALAGIGTYLLARAWAQSRQAAFLAAFLFVFSGPVLSLGNVYNTVACCAWIPWALLATERALQRGRPRSWILLTLIFALQWLAAEPFSMMATFGLSFAYALYRCGRRDKLWSETNLRLVATFFLVGCAMLLLSAVQFLPATDLLGHSRRGQGLSFRETTIWSINPIAFLDILTPNFTGSVLAGPTSWLWLISDRDDPYNISNFVGFVPVFLALVGWAMGSDRRRNFIGGATVVLMLLALGHYTPFFALARLLLPVLGVVRFPIKLLVHVIFLAAILAGWGFDALRLSTPPWQAPRRRLMLPLQIFLGCSIAILGIAWLAPGLVRAVASWEFQRLGQVRYNFDDVPQYLVEMLRLQLPGLVGFCLGGILLIFGLRHGKKWARPGLYVFALLAMYQLVAVNYDANPTVSKSFYTYRPPVLNHFTAPPGSYRFISLHDTERTADFTSLPTFVSFQSIPSARSFSSIARDAFGMRLQLYTGSMYYRVDGSLNLDQERSLPPFFYDASIYLNRMKPDSVAFNCLLGHLNVKYIISPRADDTPVTRRIADVFNGTIVPSRLYEDSCFVPRIYVVGNSMFSTSSDETLNHLASAEFDALHTVILAAPRGSTPAVSGTGAAGQAEILRREPNSVTLRAQLSRPGYVLLLDRFDPNWQATLDGRPVPVIRANQLFRAVYAGPGLHEIHFKYHQRGLLPGAIISLLTLAALGICYFKG